MLSFAWPLAGVVLALAAISAQEIRVRGLQRDLAQEAKARSDDRVVAERLALRASSVARAEEQRRTEALGRVTAYAEQNAAVARKSADDANTVAVGLRKRAATIATTCRRPAGGNPTPATDGAADRLAGVFGECVTELAAMAVAADRAIIAGNACTAAYGSLANVESPP